MFNAIDKISITIGNMKLLAVNYWSHYYTPILPFEIATILLFQAFLEYIFIYIYK